MSPILVRPVREQLEHDRVIRLLQPRYKKRRFTVGVNPGAEQTVPVGAGPDVQYPDLVLTSPGSGKKLAGVVEVETSESVNQLEAMAQWARFGRLPVEFILYVPSGVAGVARRLCSDHGIGITEIWTDHAVGDQVRFAGALHERVRSPSWSWRTRWLSARCTRNTVMFSSSRGGGICARC